MAVRVEPEGWREAMRTLDTLGPQAKAAALGPLRSVAGEAVTEARARVHRVSGRTARGYRLSVTQRGIAVTNRARGAVFVELANRPRCEQGRHLVATLNARYGPVGTSSRLVGSALERRRRLLEAEVQAAIERAARMTGARIVT